MKITRVYLFAVLFSFSAISLVAQVTSNSEVPLSINSSGVAPHASSMLDVKSSDKGILIPRLSSTQRNAISNPAPGLLVYDISFKSFWFYDGSAWSEITNGAGGAPSTFIEDADNDTRLDVEESTDDDQVQVYLNDQKHLVFHENADGTLRISFPGSSQNVFIGNLAGAANTLGSGADKNTFIGHFAGKANSTGKNNTFVGRASGALLQSGQNNAFFGISTGQDIPTGNNNAFLGAGVGAHLNQAASNNTLVGSNAGANQRYSDFNTMVGANAGRSGGEDGYNVFLGANAGEVSDSTSGNIFIGYASGKFETNDDRLYIENSNSALPLIYGEFDTDKVGINWDSGMALPNELTVNGNASKTTAGDWLANSDARLKKDIEILDSKKMLQKLISLNGISYKWNDDKTGYVRPSGIQYGFTAQNMQAVWPSIVSEDSHGYLQTSYGTLDHMFVESIKQLAKENELLKNQVNMQEQELASFKEMFQTLKAEVSNLKSKLEIQE